MTQMVIERKMNRTWYPPTRGEIRDFMETPWGKQMVADGDRTKAMEDLMNRVGPLEGIKRMLQGKGKGWRGRTEGFAIAVLATASATASLAKEEERAD
jgi:hypothetical protein